MLEFLVDKLCKPGSIIWGNCYFAIFIYMLRPSGGLFICKSVHHKHIPHMCWVENPPPMEVLHFQPVKRRFGWKATLFSPFFRGVWIKETLNARKQEI